MSVIMIYRKEIINFLFSDCDANFDSSVYVGCLNNNVMKEMKYKISDLDKISNLKYSTRCDYYITANSIKNNRKRQKSELFAFHNICIDIDLHNSNDNINTVADNLKYFLLEDTSVSVCPNIFVKTGRGVQLWWHFEECSSKLTFMYQAVLQFLINRLDELIKAVETLSNLVIDTSASSNIVGYFRMPFTTNTKTSTVAVAEILNQETYNLCDMFNLYCTCEQKKFSEQVKTNVTYKKNEYTALIMKRKKFLEKYCENRSYDVVGSRDIVMFLYCVCLVQVMSIDYVMISMKKLNSQFSEALEQSKLDSIFKYVSQKGILKFRNETFISFLVNLTDEEIKSYYSTSITNATRDVTRKISKEERNNNIIKLALELKTTEQIAQEVNCSVRTVKSFLKSINFNRSEYLKSQVVQLVGQGLSNKDISLMLKCSIDTVIRLKNNIL